MTLPCMTCTLNVYDRDGVSLRGSLNGRGVHVMIEHGMEGGVSLSGSMWEAALASDPGLFRDGIVKVSTDFGAGEVEFAASLCQAGSGTLISESERSGEEVSPVGRGLLALYSDSRLSHDRGWRVRDLGDDGQRYFGPMYSYYDDSAWVTPEVQLWYTTPSESQRVGKPYELKPIDENAYWISVTDPIAGDAGNGAVYWFRKEITLAAESDVSLWFTGDNYVKVWIDSELIGDRTTEDYGWQKLSEPWERKLPAGTYTIAARVENAPVTTGDNPIAFLLTMWKLNRRGEQESLITHTDSSWKCHDAASSPVGMTVGNIILRLRAEAYDRGVVAVSRLLPTFTAELDTDGVPWPVEEERSFPIGEDCYNIVTDLSETSVDVEATPDLQLNAWVSRGSDKTGVELVHGRNVLSYTFNTEPLTGTRAIVSTEDGYVFETDAPSEVDHDPREDFFEAGGAATKAQGRIAARRSLDDSARDRIVYTAVIVGLPAGDGYESAIPVLDFNVGDTITGLDLNLAPTPLVVESITGEFGESGPWRWTLELEEV